jgi:hypothetical protein
MFNPTIALNNELKDVVSKFATNTPVPPPPSKQKESLWDELQRTSLKVADVAETIVWPYIREGISIAKRTMKVITLACTELQAKLTPVIAKMGILSAISVFLTLKSFPSHVKSLIEYIKNKDEEGIAFAVLTLITDPIELLDSMMTFLDGLSAFDLVPTIAFFSLIGMPLAIGLLGYSIVKGLYNVIRCGIDLNALPKSLKEEDLEKFKTYLEEKIEVTAKEKDKIVAKHKDHEGNLNLKKIDREIKILKDRKKNILTRHTDVKVYNIMKNLLAHLNSEEADINTANKALGDAKKIMTRKIVVNSIGIGANVAIVTTLVSSLIFPISVYAIPAVAVGRAALAIGRHHYDHVWLKKGLELPKFIK